MAKFGNGAFSAHGFEKRLRDLAAEYAGGSAPGPQKARQNDRLKEVEGFGDNPGRLDMLAYVPAHLRAHAPLVVVLHGCTQDARGYDSHAGWTALAEREGFGVLYPEQQSGNNPQKCFNWFLPADAARGLGEARSIHQMVEFLVQQRKLDPSRVFVVGLSAGGAMAAALLGDYPETFAGGAVIAGLPCGAATSMGEAFSAMSRPRELSAERLGDLVRAGSQHQGPWPTISIWHGDKDATVAPRNADALVRQWLDVHGVAETGFDEERGDGFSHRVWRADGRVVVESYTVEGMGHGTPLDGRLGETRGPFMLDVGLSSTQRIAAFWGILKPEAKAARPEAPQHAAATAATAPRALVKAPKPAAPAPLAARIAASGKAAAPEASGDAGGHQRRRERADERRGPSFTPRINVGDVINRALKAAGLMR